eukprot:TRINITY_DN3765_c0_g1_i1.p2 TRINITY_DN3765_c0_g1~~TRINITY_DN3765_c0_g1_i1.p2  ORF type:complete len:265 (+),score=84.45 TRINITY_DN3765_c0_g1_i1:2529-3323(+)
MRRSLARLAKRFYGKEELAQLRYVVPPASTASLSRCVVLDLHETLVRVEPVGECDETQERRGAPEGCLSDGWEREKNKDVTILHGPSGGVDYSLKMRPGVSQLLRVIKEGNFEGILWTVGGVLYVKEVIRALEASEEAHTEKKAFAHTVMSTNDAYEADGSKQAEPHDWAFLEDCKPLELLNRDLSQCLQVDDRTDYLRQHPDAALIIPPYVGTADDHLFKLAEILRLLDATPMDVPVPEFLRTVPTHLAVKRLRDGVLFSCIV